MGYLCLIFFLFLIWPVNWPIYGNWAWTVLISYVAACFGVIAIGYAGGARLGQGRQSFADFRASPLVVIFGALATMVLLFPSSRIYAGRWPWEVFSALQDQGEAYRQLYSRLLETAGGRGPIALARALCAPLTFAVVPLGILNWKRLSLSHRGLVITAAACAFILSILRGTNREIADLFFVSASSFLISVGRQDQNSQRLFALVRKYWLPGLSMVLLLWVGASLFSERSNARFGGFAERVTVCANDSNICTDMEAPLISWIPDSQRSSVSLLVFSSASGFYGLSLGLEKDFRPTWGMGHSPAALAVYELITGDETLNQQTYTYRNSFDGWSDENYWSTLILWLANDLGFPGALAALAFLGFVWGRSWRDATIGQSDPAAVIFCQSIIMLVYLPANNQVFATYDGYVTFLVWIVVWLRQSKVLTGPRRHPA